jgi:drug/metabolite transporter (DMT)-like permease
VYVNINPLAATLLAALFLGERITVTFAVGFAVVLTGVVLVNWPIRSRTRPVGEQPVIPSPDG